MTAPGKRPEAAGLTLDEMQPGREASFEVTITEADIDGFAAVSGDYSPLHVDADFARARGFEGRVVHGGFLIGLMSRLIGMHLPGRNCVWQAVEVVFAAPAYIGTTVRVTGKVEQLSETVAAAVIKMRVVDAGSGRALARGKATIGISKGDAS